MNKLLRQTLAIVRKDLRRELRTREITLTTISFSVLLMVIFTFAFYTRDRDVAMIFPGILWISITFAGTLAVSRTFADERETGCLRALALIPGTGFSLYLGKLFTNLCFMLIFEAVLIPLLSLAFKAPILTYPAPFFAAVGAGTLGFTALGTLLSAMLVHHRLREVLMPLLLYPLLVPLLIGGVKAVATLYDPSGEIDSAWSWIRLMLALDVLFLVGGQVLFRWVLRAIE
jgi:heme exporter protein B